MPPERGSDSRISGNCYGSRCIITHPLGVLRCAQQKGYDMRKLFCNPRDKNSQYYTYRKKPISVLAKQMKHPFEVETLEGRMKGKAGDYLIRGVEGEMYPCDAGIFHKTYEPTG